MLYYLKNNKIYDLICIKYRRRIYVKPERFKEISKFIEFAAQRKKEEFSKNIELSYFKRKDSIDLVKQEGYTHTFRKHFNSARFGYIESIITNIELKNEEIIDFRFNFSTEFMFIYSIIHFFTLISIISWNLNEFNYYTLIYIILVPLVQLFAIYILQFLSNKIISDFLSCNIKRALNS